MSLWQESASGNQRELCCKGGLQMEGRGQKSDGRTRGVRLSSKASYGTSCYNYQVQPETLCCWNSGLWPGLCAPHSTSPDLPPPPLSPSSTLTRLTLEGTGFYLFIHILTAKMSDLGNEESARNRNTRTSRVTFGGVGGYQLVPTDATDSS